MEWTETHNMSQAKERGTVLEGDVESANVLNLYLSIFKSCTDPCPGTSTGSDGISLVFSCVCTDFQRHLKHMFSWCKLMQLSFKISIHVSESTANTLAWVSWANIWTFALRSNTYWISLLICKGQSTRFSWMMFSRACTHTGRTDDRLVEPLVPWIPGF